MAIVSTLETRYELISQDAQANVMTLTLSIEKHPAFAPEITEEQIALAVYNQLQAAFPNNVITANRVRTIRENDLI